MDILVYGAGPLGSLFAARLKESGHDVAILARGRRLADVRKHGIVLRDAISGAETTTQVDVVEALGPEDAYDLVLVIMRKNNALDVLPILAANRNTPHVLFLMNNAAGPDAFVEALGPERVLVGFPSSAGYREGHVVHYLSGTEEQPYPVPFGEVDGEIRERTRRIAEVLSSASGLQGEIRTDMDAWLKYHVALLMPSLAPALYMAGTDHVRMAETRDAVVLAVRAIREGFRVLKAHGYPITPARLRVFTWLPEPLVVAMLQRRLADPAMEVAIVKHARAGRDEIRHLAGEFAALARRTSVPTPAIDRLAPYLDPGAPPLPRGSAAIPLDWREVGLFLGVVGTILGLVGWWLFKQWGLWDFAGAKSQGAKAYKNS